MKTASQEVTLTLPAETWDVRDAVQLAVFQLFDRRDPLTAHEVTVKPATPELPAVVTTVVDPYKFDTRTFQISSSIDGDQLSIVASCSLAE